MSTKKKKAVTPERPPTEEDQIVEVQYYLDLFEQHLKAGTVDDHLEAKGWAKALIEEAELLQEAIDTTVAKEQKALTRHPKKKPQGVLRIRSHG